MHRLKSNWGRSLPAIAIALAAAAVLAIIVALNLGSGSSSVVASNLTPTAIHTANELQKFTGVSCADISLDIESNIANWTPLGSPPAGNDLLVASALSRTEPSKTVSGGLQTTTVSYQGPDLVTGDEDVVFDVVPDTGPTVNTCLVARNNGQNTKEQERMHQRTAFVNQFGNRPTAQAKLIVGTFDPTNNEDGTGANTCFDAINNGPSPDGLVDSGDPDCYDAGTTTYIHFSTCTFSEVLSVWQRAESTNVITNKNPKAVNYGRVTLYVAVGTPPQVVPGKPNEALDPTKCAILGSLPFPSVTVLYARDATTDHPELAQNAAAITKGKLEVDLDGCNPSYGTLLTPKPPTPLHPNTPTPKGLTTPTPTLALPPLTAPCNPKPKDGQERDGDTEQYVGYVADDWDGDGCPDWDELDHQFVHNFTNPMSTNQNGMDPYNPNDCDKNFNGNIGLFVVVFHDNYACTLAQLVTEGSVPGSCSPEGPGPGQGPNGQYFICRTSVTHAKGVDVSGDPGLQEQVNWVSGCYSDSTVQVVNASYFAEVGANCAGMADNDGDGFINDGCPKVGATSETGAQCAAGDMVNDDFPDDTFVNDGCPAKPDACGPAAQDDCGDGRAGGRPPGGATRNSPRSFLAIDDATYPVPFIGVYDHQDNRLKFDICLVGFGGSFFGPNVHATGNIDAHTGGGLMQLYGGLTAPDCSGTPTLTLPNNEVLMVEQGQNVDLDHDGCTDNQELGSNIAAGGKADVFNKWDYFNPSLNNTNRTKDITAVVSHFGHDASPPGDPLYKQRYDRGGSVPGAHPWNLLPPNGTIRAADITAAVNSFGHDCVAKTPPPFTS